jgi:DtxR family manganese transport transcriptional regulator
MSRSEKAKRIELAVKLPAELTQAQRFGKARSAQSGAVLEDYGRLKREGLATGRPYRGVFLTDEGQKLAARVRARHRIVVDVLIAVGVPAEAAEADAEGMEHYVSDTTLKVFSQFLQSQA